MIEKNYYRVYYYPAYSVVIEAFDEGEALDIAMETPLADYTYDSEMDEYVVEDDEDTDEDEEDEDAQDALGEGEFDDPDEYDNDDEMNLVPFDADDLGENDYDAGH